MLQTKALSILKAGKNVFLTGSAGAGKTFVLNQYIQYLKEREIPVSVTASTGIAATHIEGNTIHAWSGIGIKNKLSSADLADMKDKKYLKENLENCKVLIIDEISMLHRNQLEMVNRVLKYFKKTDNAFGGVQVVLCGDFFQLPPVGDHNERNADKFAFMSPSWVEAKFTICYLTEQFRQTDNQLNFVLNEIRSGDVSRKSINHLKTRENANIEATEPTKLYTHNIDVDRINREQLASIDGSLKKIKATVKGNPKLIESIKKSISAPETIELKERAKVMFVKNNHEKGYLNGSLGEILKYNESGFPVVKMLDGNEITAEQEEWKIEDDKGKVLVSYKQIPLRLAWAITVHKSQGMTLDCAEVDLSKTFERGQGYVALSRLKELEGLRLVGLNQTALEVDALALKADMRFQQLSKEAELQFFDEELEIIANQFIEKCGGITNLEEIEENRSNLKRKKKVKKKSTYLITKQMIDKGHSLSHIAMERELSEGTIVTHLLKISEMYPDTNLSRFKPTKEVMDKIEKAYKFALEQGDNPTLDKKKISLKMMYDFLGEEVSYEDIKLGIIFV